MQDEYEYHFTNRKKPMKKTFKEVVSELQEQEKKLQENGWFHLAEDNARKIRRLYKRQRKLEEATRKANQQ